jgi:hypothetical protein
VQHRAADVGHLAALTGLTSLTYVQHPTCVAPADAIRAVGQLTRLRDLTLIHAPACGDARLAQLSTLCRLTGLVIGHRSLLIEGAPT